MASLLDLAEARLRGLLDIPTRAARAIVNPTAFSGLLGGPTLPREQGFAEGFAQLPAKTDMSVLEPSQAAYMQGYDVGVPYGLLASIAPFTKGMPVGASIKDVSKEMSKAMKTAQKNAALPIEKGGLGLPKDNTPMDRARAMGYDIPVFHGTNADIAAFNVEGKGKTAGAGAFFTTNPITAETYVNAHGGGNIMPLLLNKDNFLSVNARGRNWADIWTNQLSPKIGKKRSNLEQLELNPNSATSTDELGGIANMLGLKGAEIKNVKDLGPNSHVMRAKEYLEQKYGYMPKDLLRDVSEKDFYEAREAMKKMYEKQISDIYAVQDPSLIRSRFAAFDPKRRKEADILAGFVPFGLLGVGEEE